MKSLSDDLVTRTCYFTSVVINTIDESFLLCAPRESGTRFQITANRPNLSQLLEDETEAVW